MYGEGVARLQGLATQCGHICARRRYYVLDLALVTLVRERGCYMQILSIDLRNNIRCVSNWSK